VLEALESFGVGGGFGAAVHVAAQAAPVADALAAAAFRRLVAAFYGAPHPAAVAHAQQRLALRAFSTPFHLAAPPAALLSMSRVYLIRTMQRIKTERNIFKGSANTKFESSRPFHETYYFWG
jgi:hypothetical protein